MALSKILPAGQSQFAGARNLIINGSMICSQRGTQTGQTDAYTACDRFAIGITGTAVVTTSQDTTVPSGQGFSNSLKIDVTTADSSLAAGDFVVLSQTIEAQNLQHLKYGTSSAENVTLSFWVRSPKTGTHVIELRHHDAALYNSQTYTINTADTWQYVTVTYSGYTSTAINNDNGKGFIVDWILAAGSDFTSGTLSSDTWHNTQANRAVGQVNCVDDAANNFYITGVQLEVGSATPFEHPRSYGDELLRCQRYYYFSGFGGDIHPGDSDAAAAVDYEGRVMAVHIGSNRHTFFGNFPVFLRAIPTLTFYSPHDGASANAENYSGGGNVAISASYSRSRHGLNGYSQTNTSADTLTAYVEANAEL